MIYDLRESSLCVFWPGNAGLITDEAAFGDSENGGIGIEYGSLLSSCDMGTAETGIPSLRFASETSWFDETVSNDLPFDPFLQCSVRAPACEGVVHYSSFVSFISLRTAQFRCAWLKRRHIRSVRDQN